MAGEGRKDQEELKLSPEAVEAFFRAVEKAERRRKIMLGGYLLALVVLIVGMVASFVVVGSAPKGKFMGWVFLLPFLAVGIIFVIFGRWSKRAM